MICLWGCCFIMKARIINSVELGTNRMVNAGGLMQEYSQLPKTISVLLDIEGTCDFIDDDKAQVFMQQLNYIRKKFCASYATISLSTHFNNVVAMKEVLDVLARNLSNNIEIGMSFYLGGMYDYKNDQVIPISREFNRDKVKTFANYYIDTNEFDNKWFAIIDDNMSDDVYKKYKDKHPMLLAKPSQREESVVKNNFMRIGTVTKGFDGVIEILDSYKKSTDGLSSHKILETQKEMICHLSSWELSEKIQKEEFQFVEKYFSLGLADEGDYVTALIGLKFGCLNEENMPQQCEHLDSIFNILLDKFTENNQEDKIEAVKVLKGKYSKFN